MATSKEKAAEIAAKKAEKARKRKKTIKNAVGKKTYKEMMAHRESSDKYDAWRTLKNGKKSQFLGKYQIGTAGLKDSGYIDKKTGKWTGKKGVKNKKDFLANSAAQEDAMSTYTSLNEKYLKNNGSWDKIGMKINGKIVTKEGLLAAAHLGGHGGAKKLLVDGNDSVDGLGTKFSEYLDMGNSFANKDLETRDNPTNNAGKALTESLNNQTTSTDSNGVLMSDINPSEDEDEETEEEEPTTDGVLKLDKEESNEEETNTGVLAEGERTPWAQKRLDKLEEDGETPYRDDSLYYADPDAEPTARIYKTPMQLAADKELRNAPAEDRAQIKADRENRVTEAEKLTVSRDGKNYVDPTGRGRTLLEMNKEKNDTLLDPNDMRHQYNSTLVQSLAKDGVQGEGEDAIREKDYSGAFAGLDDIGEEAPFAPAARSGALKGFSGVKGGDAADKVTAQLMSSLGKRTARRNTGVSSYRGGRPRYVSAQRPQGILSK